MGRLCHSFCTQQPGENIVDQTQVADMQLRNSRRLAARWSLLRSRQHVQALMPKHGQMLSGSSTWPRLLAWQVGVLYVHVM